ncbi:hypothetical protein EZV73_18310 [Acidaminobacter sp. JC074]|uniref:hypothetical protein n=1 Tax=Acidaminobacter sp. JC074 TaxID=2530199 RepID=UPI001F0D9D1C|nr:hypothetical protein [Acidaminobacter sp. JC074]MCH4889541.1 hypothetical protein [Acidaminobacter sp. JC074]
MLYIGIFIIAAIVGILVLMGYNMPASKSESTHLKMGTLIAVGSFIILIALVMIINQLTGGLVTTGAIGDLLQLTLI